MITNLKYLYILVIHLIICASIVAQNCEGVTAYAGEDQSICSTYTTLNASPPNIGASGNWSLAKGGGIFVPGTSPSNATITSLSNGENKLVWTVSMGSCIARDTVVITNNKPTTANAGNDITISDNEYTLLGNSPQYGTGQWTLISGAGKFDDITNPNTVITGLNKKENILRWTISNFDCQSFDDVVVTVDVTTGVENAKPDCMLSVFKSSNSDINLKVNTDCMIDNWELISITGNVVLSGYHCNSSHVIIKNEYKLRGLYIVRITLKGGITEVKKVLL